MPAPLSASFEKPCRETAEEFVLRSKIRWKNVSDIVYRTRWHNDPEVFAEIFPTLTNKLSLGNLAKFSARKEAENN